MLKLHSGDYNDRVTLFAEVVLPLAISRNYTYRIPFELNQTIRVGQRVIVQFGKNKVYTALVYQITTEAPTLYEAKYIISVLDDVPLVTENQLRLWQWISSYYMCYIGEVMNAALPAAMKLASETKITLNREHEFDKSLLNDKEFLVVDALELKEDLSISDIMKVLGQKTVMPVIKSLNEKRIVLISEELNDRYKPKLETFVKLHKVYNNPDQLKELFSILERAPKQVDLLMVYLHLSKLRPALTKKSYWKKAVLLMPFLMLW